MLAPQPVGRRERNKQRVRAAIVEAAHSLFQDRGFAPVSVEDIVARAGVSRRTFFRYFPSKESVVFPGWEARMGAFRERLETELAATRSPARAVRRALRLLAETYKHDFERERMLRRVVMTSPSLQAKEAELFADLEEAIAERISQGRSRADAARARIIACAIGGAVRASFRTWIEGDGRLSLRQLEEVIFDRVGEFLTASRDDASAAS